ncbi:hypothetical protein HMPREF0591_3644 [Mycobacterium parascrofulaceum ATCC BAA-614]|uniref:Uncharacterized protein n=1 Tax=Mycobacterium parascrofulaceum ATCC BAA-614 TaxID=525368 RepID=D5PBV0_9MYCO|nr:hypothetical protein HMPREF0591_3644 [Mycobacterium parascrofulaceum ATCC BAA-614]
MIWRDLPVSDRLPAVHRAAGRAAGPAAGLRRRDRTTGAAPPG